MFENDVNLSEPCDQSCYNKILRKYNNGCQNEVYIIPETQDELDYRFKPCDQELMRWENCNTLMISRVGS